MNEPTVHAPPPLPLSKIPLIFPHIIFPSPRFKSPQARNFFAILRIKRSWKRLDDFELEFAEDEEMEDARRWPNYLSPPSPPGCSSIEYCSSRNRWSRGYTGRFSRGPCWTIGAFESTTIRVDCPPLRIYNLRVHIYGEQSTRVCKEYLLDALNGSPERENRCSRCFHRYMNFSLLKLLSYILLE